MNENLITENVEQQKKEQLKKLANHFNYSTCDELEKPLFNPEQFIVKNGIYFQLDTIIENNSKACSKKHNSDIAVYKVFNGAIGYDS